MKMVTRGLTAGSLWLRLEQRTLESRNLGGAGPSREWTELAAQLVSLPGAPDSRGWGLSSQCGPQGPLAAGHLLLMAA